MMSETDGGSFKTNINSYPDNKTQDVKNVQTASHERKQDQVLSVSDRKKLHICLSDMEFTLNRSRCKYEEIFSARI